MKIYDFRKNGQFSFNIDEVMDDTVLFAVSKRLKTLDGRFEVSAANNRSAFRKFFGVSPDKCADIDRRKVPDMYSTNDGWVSVDGVYEIVPENIW